MAMPRKPDPEKYCKCCGEKMERKVYGAVGNLRRLQSLATFRKQKYCSWECSQEAIREKKYTMGRPW